MNNSSKVFIGKLVNIDYKGHSFKTVVIEPNGMGYKCPTVGYNFREAEKHLGIPHSTLSTWVVGTEDNQSLKLPSGVKIKVFRHIGQDNNSHALIEVLGFNSLATDLFFNPGQTRQGKNKRAEFLNYFNAIEFYKIAYDRFGIECNSFLIEKFCESNKYQMRIEHEKDKKKFKERDAVMRLQKETRGLTEVKTPVGSIDLLTSTQIIEVKEIKSWKHAIGQVLMYGNYYPSHEKRIHLYGNCHSEYKKLVELNSAKVDVIVTWGENIT